jgi:hypothetical protein
MEQQNNIIRSGLWKAIFKFVNKIPRKDVNSDAYDAGSITSELEQYFKEQLLSAYKDGFDSATESLITANNMIQKRKI